MCPVYQMVPSGAAKGSWGREPGVGTFHSLKETSPFPATGTAAGAGFSGKFLIKYDVTVSTLSLGTFAPTFSIIATVVFHSSGEWPEFVILLRLWQAAHARVTISLPSPSGTCEPA